MPASLLALVVVALCLEVVAVNATAEAAPLASNDPAGVQLHLEWPAGISASTHQSQAPARRLLLKWRFGGLKWWQLILLLATVLCMCTGCLCIWLTCGCVGICGCCVKKATAEEEDGDETEELLSDTEPGHSKSGHRHKSGHHHHNAQHQHHEVWLSNACPACGTPYLGRTDVFCHICKRPRDRVVNDHRGHEVARSPPQSQMSDKREKKRKKEKKEKRRRSRSPNSSIQMHAGSPYLPEPEQTPGDPVYNMYADVYYSGQHPGQRTSGRPGPVPLPHFPTPPQSGPPHFQKSSTSGHAASGSHPASSGHAASKSYGSNSYGSGAHESRPQGPRVIETIVHEPVLESGSAGFGTAVREPAPPAGQPSMPFGAFSSVFPQASASASTASLARFAPPERPPAVRPTAEMATSGVAVAVPHLVSEERRLVGEVVHEPIIPQRLGEVSPAFSQPGSAVQMASLQFPSQGSYTSSYQSGYSAPAKSLIL